ncbi:MAG TPA: hypothetical protein EYP10_11175, partial [Armatimonadetes bacterium]|nr:hypothetical protein [Armatimonadota bacterium]
GKQLASLVYPCYRTMQPITIDGKLTEPAWERAPQAGAFTDAHTGVIVEPQTIFRVLYDDAQLYIGVKCIEPLMTKLVANVTVRDGQVWFDDCIELFFDTNHDHTTYFQLVANSVGAQFDRTAQNMSWSGDWLVAAMRSDGAWFLEFAIPFATLDCPPPKPGDAWGFNICRERYATGEQELFNWSPTGGNFHTPQNFGHLLFAGEADESLLAKLSRRLLKVHGHLQVCLQRGLLRLRANKPPKVVSYAELARRDFRSPDAQLRELEQLVQHPAAAQFKSRVRALKEMLERASRLATGKQPLSVEQWTWVKHTSQRVMRELNSLIWDVKLELLLSED